MEKKEVRTISVMFNFGSYAKVGVKMIEGKAFEDCIRARSKSIVAYYNDDTKQWKDL